MGISDKTVSKWKCGNGMPELSFLQPVCQILNIDLNELFSGERLTGTEYKKNAEKNIMELVKEAEKTKKSIVGGSIFPDTHKVSMNACKTHQINTRFWNTIGNDTLGPCILPDWGGFSPSENKLHLPGDLTEKKVLEIGCGNGHSLKYVADAGASDLWGLDISSGQIRRAREFLTAQNIHATLICSPMEDTCGLPSDYFDLVFSVYGIGWTTSLDQTLQNIHSCLKKDGVFIFGWSHPVHKCVTIENGSLIFRNSYFHEEWYSTDLNGQKMILSNRMMSTYINVLADHGFFIEKLIEETDREKALASKDDFGKKALMLPTVFILKARKC